MVELLPYRNDLDSNRELAFRSEVRKKASKTKKKIYKRKQTDIEKHTLYRVLFPNSQNHMQIQASSIHWEITYIF